jgi:hypothetical protein
MAATEKQFIDAIFKLATEEDVGKRWYLNVPWKSSYVFYAIRAAGFILVEKKTLGQELQKSKQREEKLDSIREHVKARPIRTTPQGEVLKLNCLEDWMKKLEELCSS